MFVFYAMAFLCTLFAGSHGFEFQGNISSRNCLQAAMQEYPEFHPNGSMPFHPRSNNFDIFFFPVRGDENKWRNLAKGHWQYRPESLLITHAFIGDMYRRAIENSFDLKNDILIDVGGNMGQEAIIAGFFNISSVTFEILPQSVEAIYFNLAANCIPKHNFQIVLGGVGVGPGDVWITRVGFTAGFGTSNKRAAADGRSVPIRSIDEMLFKKLAGPKPVTRRPLLFKIDCEGCEKQALKSATELLTEFPPHYILIEIINRFPGLTAEVAHVIDTLNYKRAYILDKNDAAVKSTESLDLERRDLDFWARPYTAEKCGVVCDVVMVHNSAVDLGYPLPPVNSSMKYQNKHQVVRKRMNYLNGMRK